MAQTPRAPNRFDPAAVCVVDDTARPACVWSVTVSRRPAHPRAPSGVVDLVELRLQVQGVEYTVATFPPNVAADLAEELYRAAHRGVPPPQQPPEGNSHEPEHPPH